MLLATPPFLRVNQAWYADDTRIDNDRIPGAFKSLVNIVPNLSDGIGRVRTGYEGYDSSHGGIDAPTGTEILLTAPIQNPADTDLHLFFTNSGSKKVQLYPHYVGATNQNSFIDINYTKAITAIWDNSLANNKIRFNGNADSIALSSTDDYYKGWMIRNDTIGTEYVQIASYDYTAGGGGTAVFTLVEDIDAGSMNWTAGDDLTLVRCFHENPTFAPTYNDDKANPPTMNSENSVIRFSGGQGSDSGLTGIILFPRLTRTFFSWHSRAFTVDGTYASERRLKPLTTDLLYLGAIGNATGSGNLLGGYTYWLAVAAIYDGYQLGELLKFETPATYNSTGSWTQNYNGADDGRLELPIQVRAGTLNKRITGIAIYLAQDTGDTRTSGRRAPYYFVRTLSFTTSDGYSGNWTYGAADGTFRLLTNYIEDNPTDLDGPTSYQTDSGFAETPLDTMYSYSIESVISGRRFLANAYVTSASEIDRSHVFVNPTGGNPTFNAGIVAPDAFPNEEVIYKLRVNPMIGTKIMGIIPTGIDEFLVVKERGVVAARLVVLDRVPDLTQQILSQDVGMSTVNGWAKDDDGVVFFPGFDDIYAFDRGNLKPAIERTDKNDWLQAYRNISATKKESATVFYLPELKSLIFTFDNTKAASDFTGMQYLYYRGLWSQLSYGETGFAGVPTVSFRWATQLRNGHVIVTSTESTPATYRMSFAYSAGPVYSPVYTDNGTGIVPYFDTGDLLMGKESVDTFLQKLVVNRKITGATLAGQLDIDVLNENSAGLQKTAISSSDTRITLRFGRSTVKRGQSWKVVFNKKTSGRERLTAGSIYQINSLEYFGTQKPRVKYNEK